jgi:hypothetical protein
MSDLPSGKVALVVGLQSDESSNPGEHTHTSSVEAWSTQLRAAGFAVVDCPINPTAAQLLQSIQDLEKTITSETLAVFVCSGYAEPGGESGPGLTCKDCIHGGVDGNALYAGEDPAPMMREGLLGVMKAMSGSQYNVILLDACTSSASRTSRCLNLLNYVQDMLGKYATINGNCMIPLCWPRRMLSVMCCLALSLFDSCTGQQLTQTHVAVCAALV